jgi:hypothetical protein
VENQTTAPPDPAGLAFAIPREAVVADDLRATLLTFWIHRARLAGHVIAEHLRPGSPESDAATGSRHCGTARIGGEAFDIYASDHLNQVYAVRVEGENSRALLGLDQVAQVARLKVLAPATQTAYELIELVERANNLLRTDVGNDVERDAVRDQADMLGIIATLLPAWADRGLHADTENNIDMAAARLTHLLDELES